MSFALVGTNPRQQYLHLLLSRRRFQQVPRQNIYMLDHRIHNDVRKDGRHCVLYSLSNKQHISQHLLPLLRKNFVLSKARLRYHTWLQTHFSSHGLEYKVGK